MALTKYGIDRFGAVLAGAALLLGACGGRSSDTTAVPSASGGSDQSVAGGGSAGSVPDGSSAGGTPASGGSGACERVVCESIPKTCTKIVQSAKDCCPTCLDSGCAECPELSCEAGTHPETSPGDCCASCVDDPPDACAQGREAYDQMRRQLLDKYGSGSCKNSAECGLASEDNACARNCDVALPTNTINNYLSNLDNQAKSCKTCAPPAQIECDAQAAACVNGKCVGVAAK